MLETLRKGESWDDWAMDWAVRLQRSMERGCRELMFEQL